jgi:hypothetical protein
MHSTNRGKNRNEGQSVDWSESWITIMGFINYFLNPAEIPGFWNPRI